MEEHRTFYMQKQDDLKTSLDAIQFPEKEDLLYADTQ
jgi:hypothetical protein